MKPPASTKVEREQRSDVVRVVSASGKWCASREDGKILVSRWTRTATGTWNGCFEGQFSIRTATDLADIIDVLVGIQNEQERT